MYIKIEQALHNGFSQRPYTETYTETLYGTTHLRLKSWVWKCLYLVCVLYLFKNKHIAVTKKHLPCFFISGDKNSCESLLFKDGSELDLYF